MIYLYHLILVPLCSPSAVTPGYLCLIAWLGIVLGRRTDGGERNWHAAIGPAVERCDWLVSKQRIFYLFIYFFGKTCNSGAQQVEREDSFLFCFSLIVLSCNEWKINIFDVLFMLFVCFAFCYLLNSQWLSHTEGFENLTYPLWSNPPNSKPKYRVASSGPWVPFYSLWYDLERWWERGFAFVCLFVLVVFCLFWSSSL